MTNITKKIISVLMVLALVFSFAACEDTPHTENSSSSETTSSFEESSSSSSSSESQESTSSSTEHEHTFGEWNVTKNATCTENGEKKRICFCGETETETLPAINHAWNDGVITKEPTETETGVKTFTCGNCSETRIESIPVLEHTHNYEASVTEPTCAQQGYTTHTCSCGESYVDSYVDAKGHSWDEGVITKEPTETETGVKTFTCGNCSETQTETLPLLEHTHKHEASVTAPTCTEKGYTTFTCPCGDSYVDNTVDATGHTESIVSGKEATCEEDGITEGKECSVCGEILLAQESIPASGHSWDDGAITKEPTETETGIKTFTCGNCGETKTQSIPVLDHTHKYKATVTAPTCTAKGFTTYTCSCGDSSVDDHVDANGHSMGDWKQSKAPTCTEKGEEKSTCANCTHFETREIDAKGHSYTPVVTAPTCTEEGFTTHTCSCGDSYVDNRVAAKGHSMSAWEQTKAPSCTEEGEEKSECANCTHFETKAIRKTEHHYSATVTNPTCTEGGYTTYTCSCGASYKVNPVPATGHNEQTEKGQDSTCLKTGLTGKIFCSDCETVLVKQSVIPKKDHHFDHQGCSVCGITFADNDGYRSLAAFQNGIAMQAFYQELDRMATEFHTSNEDLTKIFSGVAMVGSIDQNAYNLSLAEAELVYHFYKNDHPHYFWLYYGIGTTDVTNHFALITDVEYAYAANRAKYNALILAALNEYLALVKDEDSAYEIALAFHDQIINNTFYTQDPTDMNAVWAHNILGVFEKGNGVCETYAQTFQLLLNCAGVENVYVTGTSETYVRHVWNMVQLDDGKWYWCDLTWDDDENNAYGFGWGISYNYFCVSDTQSVWHYLQDGGLLLDMNGDGQHDVSYFLDSHIPDYLQLLPGRSDVIYDGSLRDTFEIDGLQFAISGYRTVQFVLTMKQGTIDIPETVEYNGVTYTVTSVGKIKNGIFVSGRVVAPGSTLNLPSTVIYVWGNAY